MKRIFWFFPLFLFLAACNKGPAVGDAFDRTVNDYEGITMTVVEGTACPDTVTVEVLNTTETEIISGNAAAFGLQVERDGRWYWLERKQDEFENTAEALVYAKDEPQELTFTWENTYGSLEPGHYRVTKRFSGKGSGFLLASEFTLESAENTG